MEHSDDEVKKIRETYIKRRSLRIRIFVFTLVFLIIVGAILLPVMDNLGIPRRTWAPFVYFIMFIIIIAITFVWRCPVCNALLGDIFNTKFCSKCGFKFYQDKIPD